MNVPIRGIINPRQIKHSYNTYHEDVRPVVSGDKDKNAVVNEERWELLGKRPVPIDKPNSIKW